MIQSLEMRVAKAAGMIKLTCGVANNAAWMVAIEGYSHAQKCGRYRHDVKKAFRRAIQEFHDYENRLIHATENCMFHVDDMEPEIRKRYGNITDRQYYDFWVATGGQAYEDTKPLIYSLQHKYELSLNQHNVTDAGHVAWVLTAMAAIQIAVELHKRALADCIKTMQIPKSVADFVFGQFSLERVSVAWKKASDMLSAESSYDLGDLEKRNIEHGLTQLCDAWISPNILYDSTLKTVEDSDEMFATKGYKKKILRELSEVKADTEKEFQH